MAGEEGVEGSTVRKVKPKAQKFKKVIETEKLTVEELLTTAKRMPKSKGKSVGYKKMVVIMIV